VPGRWESDLNIGSKNSAIATVVEPQSWVALLYKLKNRKKSAIFSTLTDQMLRLSTHLLKNLTRDCGQEMSAHKGFTLNTDMTVYFCHLSSPWQLGTNENTDGLLRQHFPKDRSVGIYNQKQLDEIANKLNTKPLKTLGFETPADIFNDVLHDPLECTQSNLGKITKPGRLRMNLFSD
jgi:IS30 family transposase